MGWLQPLARPNFFQLYTPDVISAQHEHVLNAKMLIVQFRVC
jgi:hypothetical protein